MATRNIVPRGNGEGQLGTAAKHWAKLFADVIHEGANLGNNASLGYRQPNTTYEVGNIAYHASLPTGWYLECTTAGTTGSGALTISSPSIGWTVSDGTVTWTINQSLSSILGIMYGGDICRDKNNGFLRINGGKNYEEGAHLLLAGKDNSLNPGAFILTTVLNGDFNYFTGRPDGSLTWAGNDLAGSAIVAKSLGTNGYIKYASGLIVQWGRVPGNNLSASNPIATVIFPVSFTTANHVFITPEGGNSLGAYSVNKIWGHNTTKFEVYSSPIENMQIQWFAIGY